MKKSERKLEDKIIVFMQKNSHGDTGWPKSFHLTESNIYAIRRLCREDRKKK